MQILVAELRKALGLTSSGAEVLFQEICPVLPRVVHFLQLKEVEELLWLVEEQQWPEQPEIQHVRFEDLDVLYYIRHVVRGRVGWRVRARERAALWQIKAGVQSLQCGDDIRR